MTTENMYQKSHESQKYSDEKLENDQIWCNFVTKRAQMGKKITDTDVIRKELKEIVNPFSQELVVEIDIRLSPTAKIMDPVYGEIPASTDLEKAKSTKVYKTAELRNRCMNLSATAQRMLWFIVYEIEGSDDWIELDPEWYKEVSMAGSRNMYKKAKDELERYGYISPTRYKNIWWVNPALVYGGNRIKKFEDKVVIKNTFTGKPEPRRKPPKKEGMHLTKRINKEE